MADKTIEQWEQERGLVVDDVSNPKKKVSEAAFNDLMASNNFKGVNHKDRVQFLEANGHDVTRENLTNTELSHRDEG